MQRPRYRPYVISGEGLGKWGLEMLRLKYLVATCVLALTAGTAQASSVTWDFTATVTNQTNSGYSIGSSITGLLTFDNSFPGTGCCGSFSFAGPVGFFQVAQFQSPLSAQGPNGFGAGNIYIQDNVQNPPPGPFINEFKADLFAYISPTGPNRDYFVLDLKKSSINPSTAINSTSLPTLPFDPSAFDIATLTYEVVQDFGGTPQVLLEANVNSIQLAGATTPLPSTWLMLLSGFVGIGFLAYRGTKKNAAAIAAA